MESAPSEFWTEGAIEALIKYFYLFIFIFKRRGKSEIPKSICIIK